MTNTHILKIQKTLEQNDAGFRSVPGTTLVNQNTGHTVYTPPQDKKEIIRLMDNLVDYINTPQLHEIDPLVKMAVIHFQFESIHPFYDGNGRTGRIINILYLVLEKLLSVPVLYLSRYIIQNKAEYYRLLQSVRETGNWEQWILYMLDAVEQTSTSTIELIEQIKNIMMDYKHHIREKFPKLYSQDLINNLFRHPYTKIDLLMKDLNISRITATKYLDTLEKNGFLVKQKIGRTNFYINDPLFRLLSKETLLTKESNPYNIETKNPGSIQKL